MRGKTDVRGKTATKGEAYVRRGPKKFCQFCRRKIDYIDYKDLTTLQRYISDRGKIRPRRTSGNCVQHQNMLARAIKRAREMALLPYVVKRARS
ncbi:MAG: 30S ribosomal protein S18 [Actinomycetota bacterium]